MIDTVKMAVPYQERPEWFDSVLTDSGFGKGGLFRAKIHPKYTEQSYKREGIYVPKLQYVERPATQSRIRSYDLYIELSLPKLYFGNNFSELTDDLFSAVIIKLSEQIQAIYGIEIMPRVIERATLSRVDYSKNTVFTDRTPVSTIINILETADVSKTYDMQKANFKNGGQILHIHANSIDVVMYDKVADLRQSKMSEKRTYAVDNYVQLSLIEQFDEHPNVTVPRWEIRLSGRRRIRQELKAIGVSEDLRFSHLFSSDISRKVLLRHWQKIINKIPHAEITATTATQILVAHKQADPDMKFAKASALTLMQLLRKEARGERAVRNIIEGLFGTVQYYRLKKMTRDPPQQIALKDLQFITDTLMAMKPVSITDFV